MTRFKPGDRVTWSDDYHASELLPNRERHGDGPFTVSTVELARADPFDPPSHAQYVRVDQIPHKFAGSYFRLIHS